MELNLIYIFKFFFSSFKMRCDFCHNIGNWHLLLVENRSTTNCSELLLFFFSLSLSLWLLKVKRFSTRDLINVYKNTVTWMALKFILNITDSFDRVCRRSKKKIESECCILANQTRVAVVYVRARVSVSACDNRVANK